MPYIDIDYYRNTYQGMPVDDDETLNRLIQRASRLINTVTRHRITQAGGLGQLPAFIQEQVKEATAAQTEYLAYYGETSSNINTSQTQSVRVGKFNYSTGKQEANRDTRFAQGALDALLLTGLLYAGVATISSARRECW
ncbi:hypothetical protein CN899_07995 [Bacillus thuringiensis]|uniref:Uncharacterized protein n=1 Tax=Bacillus thuringiensis TaxID=1428 RepID=A0A9X7GKC6_BACTU|nr:hypothetical protein CN899_07995 [Bacillus thuringiensis]